MDLLSRLEELEKAHDDASRAEPSDASSKAKASRKAVATNEKTGNGHSKNRLSEKAAQEAAYEQAQRTLSALHSAAWLRCSRQTDEKQAVQCESTCR